jgi:hypothetical protein
MSEQNTMIVVKATIRDQIKSMAAIQGKTLQELVEQIFLAYIDNR